MIAEADVEDVAHQEEEDEEEQEPREAQRP